MGRNHIYALATLLLTHLALLGTLPGPALADEDSQGVDLCLMITDCLGQQMDDTLVEVRIYRPGSGVIDSDSGYSDNGAIAFRFADLACEDEARVTLTPSMSESPDEDHVYIFIGDCGDAPVVWEIGSTPEVCPDGWWNPSRIQSVYHTGN